MRAAIRVNFSSSVRLRLVRLLVVRRMSSCAPDRHRRQREADDREAERAESNIDDPETRATMMPPKNASATTARISAVRTLAARCDARVEFASVMVGLARMSRS